jgi:glyoxylase-like metal-dependent hydrolase (beta-lactamase superfamily II)/rhodanese-related sulfurtransferase
MPRLSARGRLMLVFRQLFDPQSGSYTYLLADPAAAEGEAILIDPVFEQIRRDAALLRELGLRLVATLETHVHADHVTGAGVLRHRLGSRIAVSAESGVEGADIYLKAGDQIKFGRRFVSVRATPGHTRGCLTFVLDNESMAFTGDCLLIRGSGRTDFQDGSARELYRSVRTQIFTLPDNCLLYPAHDYRGLTVTSVGEEKRFNPRLGGALSESDFAGYMNNLKLGHPKKIDVAVPANLKCGEPADGLPLSDPDWAPLTCTFAGVWEVQPSWLEESRGVQIVDVRDAEEFDGPLGRIRGAKLIPLGELQARAAELDKALPIVTVCRAGGRSAQATLVLREAGFDKVANLAGGMLRWRAEGHAVEGGAA